MDNSMDNLNDFNKTLKFSLPKQSSGSIIKVVGVGGGGGNAVTHMYKKDITGVSFLLCNTDAQALNDSDVPDKIVLGRKITGGLGAGNKPEVAKLAAEESEEEIRAMLDDGTQMVFITAGMGGGTGTGAAAVVAGIAKEMGILTVAIVTIPFEFEGMTKIIQALTGVEAVSKNVDAILVVNNERLSTIYRDLTLSNAFAKADDTLSTAAKSIAEIITVKGVMNLDFADVKTTMEEGGVALMSNGFGTGANRVKEAIEDAITSPLLNNNDVYAARKILFYFSCSKEHEITMDETNYIKRFMKEMELFTGGLRVIWGWGLDNELEDKCKITILATGFGMDDIPEMAQKKENEERVMSDQNNALYRRFYDDYHSPVKVAVLSGEELEDDSLISLMENIPTFERDHSVINKERMNKVDTKEDTAKTKETKTTETTEAQKENPRATQEKDIFSTQDKKEDNNQDNNQGKKDETRNDGENEEYDEITF